MSPAYRAKDAFLSECGLYRYTLWRWWGEGHRAFMVVGLNPSTADALVDDPTIRRCVAFAKREGCSGLCMLNLFGLRATDPRELRRHPDPIGPENDNALATYLRAGLAGTGPVVAAWGAHGSLHGRAAAISARYPGLLCFGRTKDGHPKHPLRLRSDTPLVPFPASNQPMELTS